jgi:hypothetical protein
MEEDAIEHVLELLGRLLAERGFSYEIVVVGGSALLLLGLIRRPTHDLDVLAVVEDGEYVSAQPLPFELGNAARDVANAARDLALKVELAPDWLNGAVSAQLQSGLPPGFRDRVETRVYGTLTVHIAGRVDQIYLKLFAAVDQSGRGKHVDDLRRLNPTRQELLEAAEWVRGQDISPAFPGMVADTLRIFGVEDDRG